MKKIALYIAMACLALSACEDDFGVDAPRYSDKIAFGVNVEADAGHSASRAADIEATQDVYVTKFDGTFRDKPLYLHTIITDTIPTGIKAPKSVENSRGSMRDVTNVSDMGVSAVIWDTDAWSEDETSNILYFHNEEVNIGYNSNDGKYYGETSYYWPSAHKSVRFFAYSPYQEDFFIENEAKSPSFDYEVPVKASEQVDLLVASTETAGNAKEVVDMPFGHAMTAVQFKVAKDVPNIRISSITINNIKYKGTYTYNYDSSFDLNDDTDDVKCTEAGTWETTADVWDSYVVPFTGLAEGEELQVGTNTSGVTINYGEDVLMLMPQEFSDAEIVVVLYDEIVKQQSTITVSLEHTWEKGKHVIYEISSSDIAIDYFLTINLASTSNPGYTYSDENFRDEALKIKSPYYGKLGKYRVASYRRTTRGGKTLFEKVKWKLKSWVEVDANGNPVGEPTLATDAEPNPEWLDIFTPSGSGLVSLNKENGTMTPEVLDYGLLPNLTSSSVGTTGQNYSNNSMSYVSTASHYSLKNNGAKGTKSAPEDLSNPGNTIGSPQETANSYIVNSPGYYALPLVYGNALKGGLPNTSAYRYKVADKSVSKTATVLYNTNISSRGLAATVMGNFRDYYNQTITSPWIKTGSGITVTPEIIWQDEPCLLTDVKFVDKDGNVYNELSSEQLSLGDKYLQFRINEDCIVEGNAVVGLVSDADADGLGGKDVVWSWHIWVADQVSSDKDLYNNGYDEGGSKIIKRFTMMNSFLGYCNAETKTYSARKYRLNFVQVDENGEEIGTTNYIDIVQSPATISTYDNAPYYQHGRKDPLVGSGANGSTCKPYFDNNRIINTKIKTLDVVTKSDAPVEMRTLDFGIQNPAYFLKGLQSDKIMYNYLLNRNWCSPNYLNLWNADCDDLIHFAYGTQDSEINTTQEYFSSFGNNVKKKVVKTVYDPCPPGYEIPRMDAFTGLSLDGANSTPFFYYGMKADWTVDATFSGTKDDGTIDVSTVVPSSITAANATARKTNLYNRYTDYDGVVSQNPPFGLTYYCYPMSGEFYNRGGTFYYVPYGSETEENCGTGESGYAAALAKSHPWDYGLVYMQALGLRTSTGELVNYGNYGNALTASTLSMQWWNISSETFFRYEAGRFCFIRATYNFYGRGTNRPISTSAHYFGFNVMPAKTDSNPVEDKDAVWLQ